MFGIDDAILLGIGAGALGGGLMNKKKPLQGALLGGALGGVGGAMAPAGLLGSTPAAGGSVVGEAVGAQAFPSGTAAAFGPEATAVPSAFNLMQAPPVGSSLGLGNLANGLPVEAAKKGMLQTALGYAKPIGQAAGTALQAKQLLSPQEQPIQPSPMQPTMPNNNLGQIVSGMQQQQQQQLAQNQQLRQLRRQQRGY